MVEFTQSLPDKPIRLVMPFPPGGGADTLARLVMQHASVELGQNIIIDNRPGAGGNLGAQTVSRSPADGYTLLYGTNGTHGINKWLYKQTGYDPQKDFDPVTKMTRIAAMMVVRNDFPANSMRELLALIKANPGKYTFASAGNGTTSHLSMEILKRGRAPRYSARTVSRWRAGAGRLDGRADRYDAGRNAQHRSAGQG